MNVYDSSFWVLSALKRRINDARRQCELQAEGMDIWGDPVEIKKSKRQAQIDKAVTDEKITFLKEIEIEIKKALEDYEEYKEEVHYVTIIFEDGSEKEIIGETVKDEFWVSVYNEKNEQVATFKREAVKGWTIGKTTRYHWKKADKWRPGRE